MWKRWVAVRADAMSGVETVEFFGQKRQGIQAETRGGVGEMLSRAMTASRGAWGSAEIDL